MPRPIDADALVVEQCGKCEVACEMLYGEKCLDCKADCHCDLREAIDNAPTLDYAPVRHGEWIEGLKCSECGNVDWTKPNYCSTCGAKMEGKEDER